MKYSFQRRKQKAPLSYAQRTAIADTLIAQTMLPTLELLLRPQQVDRYASKVGGVPYLPEGFAYPYELGTEGQHPLRLLAQLNFGLLPHLPGFPDSGMLQFYISNDEQRFFGCNYLSPQRQDGFRVVYHQELHSQMQEPPRMAESASFPAQREMLIQAEPSVMSISCDDFRFSPQLYRLLYQQALVREAELLRAWKDIEAIMFTKEQLDDLYDGHRIGGYPHFSGRDPRGDEALQLNEHTILLLQLESRNGIRWGNDGVANFFITPEALSRGDFSQVAFYWSD